MTSQLGSEQACVRQFATKVYCSRGLKRGGAWAWLFLKYVWGLHALVQ